MHTWSSTSASTVMISSSGAPLSTMKATFSCTISFFLYHWDSRSPRRLILSGETNAAQTKWRSAHLFIWQQGVQGEAGKEKDRPRYCIIPPRRVVNPNEKQPRWTISTAKSGGFVLEICSCWTLTSTEESINIRDLFPCVFHIFSSWCIFSSMHEIFASINNAWLFRPLFVCCKFFKTNRGNYIEILVSFNRSICFVLLLPTCIVLLLPSLSLWVSLFEKTAADKYERSAPVRNVFQRALL